MNRLFAVALSLSVSLSSFAQVADSTDTAVNGKDKGEVLHDESIEQYRRSSLYSVLIRHSNADYGQTIDSVFMMMPTPDKFNCHDLQVKSFESSSAKAKKVKEQLRGTEKDPNISDIDAFMKENQVAKNIVAKWFDRNPETGVFDIDLVVDRGYFDASYAAIEAADADIRGRAMLADAGFDLIGKTFMIVNDITFVDHGENSAKAGAGIKAGLSILGSVASAVTGDNSYQQLGDATGTVVGTIANEVAGYKVNIISYLYRLDWNEDVQNRFYSEYWMESPDPVKKAAFDSDEDLFKMTYVGHTLTSAQNVSSKTFSTKPLQQQFLKACTRALDKAIVELQRSYDEFKVNVPLYAVNDDGTVEVKIGLKEGVNEKSRYEVLMPDMSSGVTRYVRVGMLKPVPGKIWDNRFGALEEAEMLKADKLAAEQEAQQQGQEPDQNAVQTADTASAEEGNAYLSSTTFEIISGAGKITPGLLVREVKVDINK